jgi:segregation and condensation protein A
MEDAVEGYSEPGQSSVTSNEHTPGWTGYHVMLEVFEGPLDLLLYLIKKNELDIYNIPVATITEQYLSFLDEVECIDLDRAGDFLLMAATLMVMKARALLPGREVVSEEDIDIEPEKELALRLIEYQTFKEMSKLLSESASNRLRLFTRGDWISFEEEEDEEEQAEASHDLSINEMLKAFSNLIYTIKPSESHRISTISYTVEEKMSWIRSRLDKESKFKFQSLFGGIIERIEFVVTFIALLELMHVGDVKVRQRGNFKNLFVIKTSGGTK